MTVGIDIAGNKINTVKPVILAALFSSGRSVC